MEGFFGRNWQSTALRESWSRQSGRGEDEEGREEAAGAAGVRAKGWRSREGCWRGGPKVEKRYGENHQPYPWAKGKNRSKRRAENRSVIRRWAENQGEAHGRKAENWEVGEVIHLLLVWRLNEER